MCLSCGFDGTALQDTLEDIRYRCPSCDEDLYARPPRSYAQLESLDESSVVVTRVCLEDWSRRLLELEYQTRSRPRPIRVAALVLGCSLLAVLGAAALFLVV